MFGRKIKWHRIGNKSDLLVEISSYKPRVLEIASKNLIICKTEKGNLSVLTDKCPHHGKKLSDGWCEDNKVICAYHQFSFDLETGLGCGTGVDVFDLEERLDGVYVGIPQWGFL